MTTTAVPPTIIVSRASRALADRLREAMELRQKSLADLAAATGLSEAGITAIANAEWTSKTPLLTDIWLLARALDVDTPSMLGHTPLQAQAVERATEAVAELQARLDWCRSYGVDDARIAQITQAVRR